LSSRKRRPKTVLLILFALAAAMILASLSIQGCDSSTPEERNAERQQQAYAYVIGTVWVRHPDIKGMCFGVNPDYVAAPTFTLPCEYVEHLLANPTPPGLPPLEDER